PYVIAWQGPLAVIGGMGLLFLFVRRELGHPIFGLIAMVIFGVTSVYQQAVFWYSASFSVVALDMTLLGLLAAQCWRRTGNVSFLLLSALWCLLAPAWFAVGILAGPLCSLYILVPESRIGASEEGRRFSWIRSCALALIPLLGTFAFLTISLPLTAQAI